MLEFETEEQSLQLVASSETGKCQEYWIDEGKECTELIIVNFDYSGPQTEKSFWFKTVAEAIQYANDQE
jgi:hypothetical protein